MNHAKREATILRSFVTEGLTVYSGLDEAFGDVLPKTV